MLLSGRGRFVFYHDFGIRSIIQKGGLEEQIRIMPAQYLSYSHYAAFSKQTPAAVIQQVNRVLLELERSGVLEQIRGNYHLNLR